MIIAVVPAYNEEKYIKNTVLGILPYVNKIVIVNDGSKDNTRHVLEEINDPHIIVLRHRVNLGKGAALKTGCLAAKRLGTDIIVTLDGDGQHPPEHIPKMLAQMESHNLDVIFSVRKQGDRMPLVRRLGNLTLNLLARLIFNLNLRDMWCGFRAIKAAKLSSIWWRKRDYSGEIEMALRVGRNGLHHGEYIIPTIYHDMAKGVTILNGLKLIGQMFIWRITL